jgi:hypothetical protein
MDVLAAILTCSLYADDALVRAIVDNAHDNPLSIFTPERDPDTGSLSSAPQTLDEATAQLREITAHGGRPLVGLMQVPVAWASTFGRDPKELFDPCINVSIGTAMLSEFDYVCAKPSGFVASAKNSAKPLSARRACNLRHYAEAIHMSELRDVVTLSLRYQHGDLTAPSDVPIVAPVRNPCGWGADRLFVTPGCPTIGLPLDQPLVPIAVSSVSYR